LVVCDYEGGDDGSDAELKAAFANPFYPRFWPERLEQIKKPKKPSGIFLDNMSDWMGEYWPKEWTELELQVMRDCPQHRFYTLTKQPQNLPPYSPFPENCWVGVTATNKEMFDRATYYLAEVDASIKYLSIEPLLDSVLYDERPFFGGVDWVIIGAQTKPYKPPQWEWVEEIVSAADKAGIPVFLKNNLYRAIPFFKEPFCQESMGKDGIRIVGLRQEMPNIKDFGK